jgi:hypothetical protein
VTSVEPGAVLSMRDELESRFQRTQEKWCSVLSNLKVLPDYGCRRVIGVSFLFSVDLAGPSTCEGGTCTHEGTGFCRGRSKKGDRKAGRSCCRDVVGTSDDRIRWRRREGSGLADIVIENS